MVSHGNKYANHRYTLADILCICAFILIKYICERICVFKKTGRQKRLYNLVLPLRCSILKALLKVSFLVAGVRF